ncbi:MAG: hypothetical protein ACSLE9_03880 [Burkholderiaceae bacterium]
MNYHRQTDDLHDLQDLHDLRTQDSPWTLGNLFGTAALLCFVLGAMALAMHADDMGEQRAQAYARAEQQRIAMPQDLQQAYERGLSDAVDAMRGNADGVALAQACNAAEGRP